MTVPQILGADGRPYVREAKVERSAEFVPTSYATALRGLGLPAEHRAQDPISNHPWIFSGALMTAIVASQAPFLVWRETPSQQMRRRDAVLRSGRPWKGARAGHNRSAFQRHLDGGLSPKRISLRAAEPDYEHPLMTLLRRPNPVQTHTDVQMTTAMWLSVAGEVVWLLTDEDGNPPRNAGLAERLWAIPARAFEPILEHRTAGRVLGYEYRPPRWMPNARGGGTKVRADIDQVIHIKWASPTDPLRGLSRLTAGAAAVESDSRLRALARGLLKNRAVPGGAVKAPDWSAQQANEYLKLMQEVNAGENNAGRTWFFPGGAEWVPMGTAPKDLEQLGLYGLNREESIAVMGSMPSLHGLTEFTNYATALAQRANFWEHTVLPLLRAVESAVDASLMFGELDHTFAAYDLRNVEALRAGLAEKVEIADRLAGTNLHVPPAVALEMVGLEAPDYPGSQDALVPPVSAPVSAVLDPDYMPGGNAPAVEEEGAEDADEDESDDTDEPEDEPSDDEGEEEDENTKAAAGTGPATPSSSSGQAGSGDARSRGRSPALLLGRDSKLVRSRDRRRWREWLAIEIERETAMRGLYRRWVKAQENEVLDRFDSLAKGKSVVRMGFDIREVLPDLQLSANALASVTRPSYIDGTEVIFEFTTEEIGVPVFDIADKRITDYWKTRETVFTKNTPRTVYDRLKTSLADGAKGKESLSELRQRIQQVYGVEASPYRTLAIARTETAGLLNGVRDAMFDAQGFPGSEWVSAGDENTRDDHITFGAAGPKERGFNYLSLVGDEGTLRHPGDTGAPAKQVVNCRCFSVPREEV